jgi:hypothetical protein
MRCIEIQGDAAKRLLVVDGGKSSVKCVVLVFWKIKIVIADHSMGVRPLYNILNVLSTELVPASLRRGTGIRALQLLAGGIV